MCESIDLGSSRLDGQAGLADTASADHGQQPAGRIGKTLCDLCQLAFTADEGRLVGRQVVNRCNGAEGRRSRGVACICAASHGFEDGGGLGFRLDVQLLPQDLDAFLILPD